MFERFENKKTNKNALYKEVLIRKAALNDINEIAQMNCDHDRSQDLNSYIEKYKKELSEGKSFIYIAEYEGTVVGYGRTIYAEDIDYPYSATPGWYLMGLVVKKEYRRMGIGEKLTLHRMNEITERSKPLYCVTNAQNKVSIELHKKLGFEIIDEGPGFLTIEFSGGKGYLLKHSI